MTSDCFYCKIFYGKNQLAAKKFKGFRGQPLHKLHILNFRLSEDESFFHYDDGAPSCESPKQDKLWFTCMINNDVFQTNSQEGYFYSSPSFPQMTGGLVYTSPGMFREGRNLSKVYLISCPCYTMVFDSLIVRT